jgi:hypothetical protein
VSQQSRLAAIKLSYEQRYENVIREKLRDPDYLNETYAEPSSSPER